MKPELIVIRVEVEADDPTHAKAKDKLADEMADAVLDGLQINGIREPVYGLDAEGNKVVVAYETIAWRCVTPAQQPPARQQDKDALKMCVVESGVAIPI